MMTQYKFPIPESGDRLQIIFTLNENTYDFFAPVLEEYLLDVNGDYLTLSAFDNFIVLEAITPDCNDYLRGFCYEFVRRLRNLKIDYQMRGNYHVCVAG